MGMPTTPLPPITPLPVLVKSSDSEPPDGAGHLFDFRDPDISGLHVVTGKDVSSVLKEWERSQPKKSALVNGLAKMQRAQREGNWTVFQNALDSVKTRVPHGSDAEFSFIRNSRDWGQAAWAYSGLTSNLLQKARFAIWYSTQGKGIPRPGLYCPDWDVAVYAIVGMGNIRFCQKPGCGKPFIARPSSDPKNEQTHCLGGACANAHRVARWRAAHPQRAKHQRRERAELKPKTRRGHN
jgi:hypothetical protein